jgi:hypothetical protein
VLLSFNLRDCSSLSLPPINKEVLRRGNESLSRLVEAVRNLAVHMSKLRVAVLTDYISVTLIDTQDKSTNNLF